jgi:hypothetical protein
MRNIFRIGFLLTLTLPTGCFFNETNCPSYPKDKLNWMPYTSNSSLRFSDGLDTMVFNIYDTYQSADHSYKNNCACGCSSDAYFRTDTNSKRELQIQAVSTYNEEHQVDYLFTFTKYGYDGEDYTALYIDDFYFMDSEIIPSFTVDNSTYENVIQLDKDTIGKNDLNMRKPDIWRVYLADSVGIIQFEECNTGKIWKIIK